MSEIRRELSWNGNSDAKIKVTANVTETLTSYMAGETREIDVKQTKVKVEVLSKPQVVKPGLLYKALVSSIKITLKSKFNQIIII